MKYKFVSDLYCRIKIVRRERREREIVVRERIVCFKYRYELRNVICIYI